VAVVPFAANAAVARDSTGSTNLSSWSSGTSLSWTHTTGAGLSNSIGVIYLAYNGTVSGTPTWGGSNTTLVEQYTDGDGALFYAYCILSPKSGAQTISISYTGSAGNLAGVSVVYYGAKQSCTPDSFNENHTTTGSSFSLTTSVVASNSWLSAVFYSNQGSTISAGGGTDVLLGSAAATIGLADSNGTVGTGSHSLNFTGGSGHWTGIILSIAPAVSISAVNPLNYWADF
jgi:hypothetical protein